MFFFLLVSFSCLGTGHWQGGEAGPWRESVGCWTSLGGSWVVISRVISLTIVTLLMTPLITPHEPPSRDSDATVKVTG